MFTRVIAFYGLGFQETLDLPVAAFWLFYNNIDRIQAERDVRTATIATHVTTGEGYEALGEALGKAIGDTFVFEEEPEPEAPQVEAYDRDGLLALKGLGKMM